MGADGVEAELAQGHDHPGLGQQRQLPGQERGAGVALGRRRLVGRRRALHRRGDPGVAQDQAVGARGALGLVGEAGPPQRPVEPLAGAVAREHAAGPVGPVGGGGEADDDDLRRRVTEPGHAATPVLLVGVGGPLGGGHLLAPLDQPRAPAARRHLLGHGRQLGATLDDGRRRRRQDDGQGVDHARTTAGVDHRSDATLTVARRHRRARAEPPSSASSRRGRSDAGDLTMRLRGLPA